MGESTRKASRDLGDLVELVVKALFSIVIVYLIAEALIKIIVGEQAAKIIAAVMSIALLFSVVVSKRVRDEILAFGRKK